MRVDLIASRRLSLITFSINHHCVATVTIEVGDTGLRGLFCQVRRVIGGDDSVIRGKFALNDQQLAQYETVPCNNAVNSSLTHANNDAKGTETFTWMPPTSGQGALVVMYVQLNGLFL